MNVKDKLFYKKESLNCGGRLVSLQQPLIMGILNLTPDSFFDGGKFVATEAALAQAGRMLNEGADAIDVGAQSSRPGALWLDAETELTRLRPVLKALRQQWPDVLLSVDTFYSKVVAEVASDYNVQIINDISAGRFDSDMFDVLARYKQVAILMHMAGTPQTMQANPQYVNVLSEVIGFLAERRHEALKAGISDVVIDPGFGFGKTMAHNYTLLAGLPQFAMIESPLLAGLSRKSMLYKALNCTPDEALTGTIAANMAALIGGAKLLRVHDVKEAVEVRKIFMMLNSR